MRVVCDWENEIWKNTTIKIELTEVERVDDDDIDIGEDIE